MSLPPRVSEGLNKFEIPPQRPRSSEALERFLKSQTGTWSSLSQVLGPLLLEGAETLRHNHALGRLTVSGEAQTHDGMDASQVVSAIDTAIEMRIINALRRAYPGLKVIGEETARYPLREPVEAYLLLDPVDGTGYAINGLYFDSIQGWRVAMPAVMSAILDHRNGEVHDSALVLYPFERTAIAAVTGKGTWSFNLDAKRGASDGKKLLIANPDDQVRHLILNPAKGPFHDPGIDQFLNFLESKGISSELIGASSGVVPFALQRPGVVVMNENYQIEKGSAKGKRKQGPWDIAPQAIIAREMDASVTGWRTGAEITPYGEAESFAYVPNSAREHWDALRTEFFS